MIFLKNLRLFFTIITIITMFIISGCNKHSSSIKVEPYLPTEPTQESTTEEPTTEAPTTEVPTTEAPTTEPPTTEPPTTQPPTTVPPTTAAPLPPADPNEMFGSLYTRGQLNAMSNKSLGAGFGGGKDELGRPYLSLNQQKAYGQYGAVFIDENTTDTIYLTFDLGYEWHGNTTKILDILAANNVKGTFFPTLNYIKRNPEVIKRIIEEGHTLGSHTSTHPVMTTITLDELYTQLMDVNNYVAQTYNYQITTLRPPTGAYSVRSLCATKSLGMDSIFWSYSYEDWKTDAQPDPAPSLQKAIAAAHPGAIYLLHSVSDTNVLILDDLIKALDDEYEFGQF